MIAFGRDLRSKEVPQTIFDYGGRGGQIISGYVDLRAVHGMSAPQEESAEKVKKIMGNQRRKI